MEVKILLVDDNRDTIRMYMKALRRRVQAEIDQTIKMDYADSYRTAIQKLTEDFFEILIVDLKIPGPSGEEWGGFDIINESTRLDQLRPVIVISGYGNIENVKESFKHGVIDFIEKSDTAIEDLAFAVREAINVRRKKILRSGNPFRPMSGSEPIVFGGRTEELENFEQKLYRAIHNDYCEHFITIGQWGIGKSSLLKNYAHTCHNRGYVASLVTLEPLKEGQSAIEAAKSLAEGILRGLPYQGNRMTLGKVLNFFDSIGINFFGSGLQFSRNISEQDLSAQAFLHDFLVRLWEDVKDRAPEEEKQLLIIFLDELENFMPVPEIILILRSILSSPSFSEARILFGIATTKDSWIEFTSLKKHHPLARFFLSTIELKRLTLEEVNGIIYDSLKTTGIRFSEEIVKRIFEYTNGHPFETQLLCYHLYKNQMSGQVEDIIWEKSLNDTLNDIGIAVFERLVNKLDDFEYIILSEIFKSSHMIPGMDLREKLSKSCTEIKSSILDEKLESLVKRGFINRLRKRGVIFYASRDAMLRAFFLFNEGV